MTDNSSIRGNENTGARSIGLRLVALLALILCAGAVIAAAWTLQDQVEPLMLLAGSVLAVVGLLALLGWVSGLFGFVGGTAERPFFDAVADAMGDAAVVCDAKGRAVYSNAAFLKLASKAGASRLVGIDVLFAGHPDFSEPVYQLAQAASSGKTMHRDVRVVAGSAAPGADPHEPRWLRLSVASLAGQGQAGQVLWRLMDITNDRQHQESAFARLQFIITYLDHAPAGFFSALPDGKVDYVNATLAEWLGADLVDVQGGAVSVADIVGADTAKQLAALEPAPGGSRTETFSVSLMSRSGVAIPVHIMQRIDFDREGKPLPARCMVLKQTDSAATGVALKDGDALRQISAAAPIGVAQLNDAGAVIAANTSFLELSPKIKLHGKLINAIAKGDLAELATALAAAAKTPGKPVLAEALFDNTEPRAVQLSFVAFANMPGATLVFAIDKTESKTLEVQLAQSQKMQAVGQLASGIAHDFNNVLTPIIGFADLLLAKMRPTDSAFTDVMSIKQNANRAASLVRQLLAFSRKQTMQTKQLALTEAMSSDLGSLLGRVLGEKVELEITHGRDLGFVMVDVHQFEQVIINLAVNARDAMPGGGKLYVKTYNLSAEQARGLKHQLPPGEYVVCEVADTGSGIAKDILEKIWEPFFSTKDVGKGTGLGLSMVYGIIKQTGGYIYCDSELGKGTTFSIFLPRIYPDLSIVAPVVLTEKTVAIREDFTGRGRILVVEDEDSVRAFALRALQSRGYTVVEADSGESGLQVIDEDKDGFELILSDVVMPEMDGPTMLAEIRKRGNQTKFIFMSGYAEDAFERNLENPDDFAFLQKPFSLKQLLEKVKDVMG